MILQSLCDFNSSSSITVSLNHADKLCLWLHKGTIVIQVGYHSIQIHLKSGLMNLLNQQLGQLVKTKLASALQQDNLITQGSKDLAGNEFLYILEEELF